MKRKTALFAALAAVVLASAGTGLHAQEPAAAPKREQPVTAINDRGAQPAAAPAAPAPGTRAVAAKPVPVSESTDAAKLISLVKQGGWAMIPLGFMSVMTLMFLFAFLFTLRRGAILSAHYMNTADVLLKKKDYLGLLAISSRHSEAIARVVQRTLDFLTKNPNAPLETIREIAETEGGAQAAILLHRPSWLADIGMLSPMVGLLGTVSGLIASFGVLASGQQVSQSRDVLLAAGVAEALVATATGLVVGILAFAGYAFFRNKVQTLISDLEVASAHIVGLIAMNYKRGNRIETDDEY